METITKELSDLVQIGINNETLTYDDILKDIGLVNSLNVKKSLKKEYEGILFSYNELIQICKKYDLVKANVSQYISSIPEKNIQSIKNYIEKYHSKQIRIEFYDSYLGWQTYFGNLSDLNYKHNKWSNLLNKKVYKNIESTIYCSGTIDWKGKRISCLNFEEFTDKNYLKKLRFSILAPISELNTQNNTVVNHELISDDPILLEELTPDIFRLVTSWNKEQLIEELAIKNKNNN